MEVLIRRNYFYYAPVILSLVRIYILCTAAGVVVFDEKSYIAERHFGLRLIRPALGAPNPLPPSRYRNAIKHLCSTTDKTNFTKNFVFFFLCKNHEFAPNTTRGPPWNRGGSKANRLRVEAQWTLVVLHTRADYVGFKKKKKSSISL